MLPVFKQSGDHALTVYFENEISPEINAQVCSLYDSLQKKEIKGVTELLPTFNALTVFYDPFKISSKSLEKKLTKRLGSSTEDKQKAKRVFIIPVCYDEEFALDIDNVCRHNSLTRDEVVRIHSSQDYLIYMLGFLPGFAYLGGLDERLHTPRLKSPRTEIPAGSVGIGGNQTGMYPLASPGGWQIIGKTPLKLFDAQRENPIFYNAGDYIRFKPISKEEFYLIESDINAQPEIEEVQL